MTNRNQRVSNSATILLVCLLLAVVLLCHQLVLAILFLCLLMVVFDVLEIWLPRCVTSLTVLVPKWTKTLTEMGRAWLKRDQVQIIYVGSAKERKAKLYETHMNNPNITSREFYEWQNNIDRIEKERKSEN